MIETVKYNGIDTFKGLAELAEAITKAMPDISVKHEDMHRYGVDKDIYPQGICCGLNVFHASDLNNHIGRLNIEQWNNKTPKFGIASINITDGRNSWGVDGQFKTSIHPKNIVRVAKKVFKPFTFHQIANRTSKTFSQKISNIRDSFWYRLRTNTCNDIKIIKDDLLKLHAIGYTPEVPKVKDMMDYVVEHKEDIDKYMDYNPEHYFVLVKENEVQYAKIDEVRNKIPEPCVVQSKDELPDDIKGKMFVLDITEGKDFVEEVGLKENDGAYWIIA